MHSTQSWIRASRFLKTAVRPIRPEYHTTNRFDTTLRYISRRNITTTRISPNDRLRGWIKDAQKDYPILFPSLIVATTGALSLLGLLAYDEYTRVAPQYSAYPTGVEQRLRVALHFTHVQPDPDLAAKHFLDALKESQNAGMDPFSKEVMGIRIRFSEMLEKFGRIKAAVEILNDIVKDSEERLKELDSSVILQEQKELRSGLLRGVIQARAKAASLYEGEYLQDPAAAKRTLSDAVGLLVKETKTPQHGFSENNDVGLTFSEIAAILSQMGDLYATTGEESNAVQVYMLAIDPLRQSSGGEPSCQEGELFSNIASTMTVALKRPDAKINGRPPTQASIEAARKAIARWADQAIATCNKVSIADRDQRCELSLLSAELTKADLLLESGQKVQAARMYNNLIPRLLEKKLNPLVNVARQNLRTAQA